MCVCMRERETESVKRSLEVKGYRTGYYWPVVGSGQGDLGRDMEGECVE